MNNTKVQFNNLYLQYLNLKDEIDSNICDVIEKSSFVRGSYVDDFENNFANTIGADFCVSCANGTDALYIAIKSLGINSGDEVIVPAHSWISTSSTITQAGGKVIFCDTTENTYTINPELIEGLITEKTVGIIPVHLFGQAADMDKIISIAKKHNLWVVEDCAQSHIGEYKGRKLGTIGNIGTFSFYPGKNLGAMGDAGAAVTNDILLAEKMAMTARHGGLKKGDHIFEGINSRLDGIQASILSVKLPHLCKWTNLRKNIAEIYINNLSSIKYLKIPKVESFAKHVWHLFVIKAERRNELANYLKINNIQTVINYPVALPFLPAYSYKNHTKNEFPNAFKNQSKILSLPLYPEMPEDHIFYVINKIKDFYNKN